MSMAISWKSSRHCIEMKSPARGDLMMPGRGGVSRSGPPRHPRPLPRPHLAVGHSHHALEWLLYGWPHCPARGPWSVRLQSWHGISRSKRQQHQRRGLAPGLTWSLSALPGSSPFPVCKSILVCDPSAGGRLLRPLSLLRCLNYIFLYSFLLSSQPLFSLGLCLMSSLKLGAILPQCLAQGSMQGRYFKKEMLIGCL